MNDLLPQIGSILSRRSRKTNKNVNTGGIMLKILDYKRRASLINVSDFF